MISENNRKENWMTRYYDIHMIIDDNDDCKEGYSIFVSASSEHEAIQFIIDNQLYEDISDLKTLTILAKYQKMNTNNLSSREENYYEERD